MKKIIGEGHDRKFAKLVYGHDKSFKFATVSGAGAAGGKMGGLAAKKGLTAAAGSAGLKTGKKGFKGGFAAGGGAKAAMNKGNFAKGTLKKGAIIGGKGLKQGTNAGAAIFG